MQLDRKVLAFGQLPSSKGDLYVPASGRKGYAHNLTLHNTNTISEDVVLNYHDGTNEYEILSETIPAGDSLYLEFPGEGEVVGIGGKLTGNTTTASKVTYKFSGTEEVPDTIQDDVLWEWNGTDLTQFGDGAGTPDYTVGAPNGTLSVGAVPTAGRDGPSGNVLLYTSGSATGAYERFFINDLPSLPQKYVIRARLGPRTTQTFPRVMCMGQDGNHTFSVGYGGSARLYVLMGNNSDAVTDGYYVSDTSLFPVDSGIGLEIECMAGEPSSGVDPRLSVSVQEGRGGLIQSAKGGITWTTFGAPPAIYSSTWQTGGSVRNCGISFYCNGTGASTWIGELQILRHPWAKVA